MFLWNSRVVARIAHDNMPAALLRFQFEFFFQTFFFRSLEKRTLKLETGDRHRGETCRQELDIWHGINQKLEKMCWSYFSLENFTERSSTLNFFSLARRWEISWTNSNHCMPRWSETANAEKKIVRVYIFHVFIFSYLSLSRSHNSISIFHSGNSPESWANEFDELFAVSFRPSSLQNEDEKYFSLSRRCQLSSSVVYTRQGSGNSSFKHDFLRYFLLFHDDKRQLWKKSKISPCIFHVSISLSLFWVMMKMVTWRAHAKDSNWRA